MPEGPAAEASGAFCRPGVVALARDPQPSLADMWPAAEGLPLNGDRPVDGTIDGRSRQTL